MKSPGAALWEHLSKMARKELVYTVTDEGRDKGKKFYIQEMPAREAERWALRALLAMSRHGVDIPESALEGGFASLAAAGLNLIGNISHDDADALMDKMLECVKFQPDNHKLSPRPLIETDIEEILTLINLRKEVFKLHADFLKAAKS